MERSRRAVPPSSTSAATMARERADARREHEQTRQPPAGKIKSAKDSSEFIRVPRKPADHAERPKTGEDAPSRHFTVTNVGAGGTLYLKPSRMPPQAFVQSPATPPSTSDGDHRRDTVWPGLRQSAASGAWTPRLQGQRIGTYDHAIPVPPLSMANVQHKRRTRSHSFSTVSERDPHERIRSPTLDSNDFRLLINGRDGSRPKSSIDLSGGFLDLHIPHYRIGTPRFSERGTAYLHNSTYTTTTADDLRSSTVSRAEYDKLFPAPPGRAHAPLALRNNSSPYLHPSSATCSLTTPSRTPPTPPPKSPLHGEIIPSIYNRIEAMPNDPTLVQYSAVNGKIAAATPARLVAQITSPVFLDYELLSDFFLTYRCFLLPSDLLEYLLARMKWAMGTRTDAGRIVRVRTFVAIRHWVLNYFADDFLPDIHFRQRFCTLVNELTALLRQRMDRGGSDINIIGELKRCWRRTCAMFWPAADAMNTSPDADILPCGDPDGGTESSNPSLPSPLRPQPSKADFRRVSEPVHVPAQAMPSVPNALDERIQGANRESVVTMRKASIPTSPMSEASLQVLSCSVPFLRNIRPSAKASDKHGIARPPGPQRNPPHVGSTARNHKRSGSFTDALRDGRAPLPSNKGDRVDIRSLPVITFTGGLVRGLLLQPSPAKVTANIPHSPADARDFYHEGLADNHFHDRSGQNLGVKRLVGDMKRALSGRRPQPGSPTTSHRSTDSSDSRSSTNLVSQNEWKQRRPPAWQKLDGQPRIDLLGAKIGESYKEAFHDVNLPSPADEQAEPHSTSGPQNDYFGPALRTSRDAARLNSHVTAGSRSIVIMDDTGSAAWPMAASTLPSLESLPSVVAPRPLFGKTEEELRDFGKQKYAAGKRNFTQRKSLLKRNSWSGRRSSEISLHDLLTPDVWRSSGLGRGADSLVPPPSSQGRASSNVHPSGLIMPPIRNQLRRRPGGDLKATEHVHDLEPLPRPHTSGSFSTASHSHQASGALDLSGTHFSGQDFLSFRFPPSQNVERPPVSLLATHSSQPGLRPSYEMEVSKLADLPDVHFTGGIEDALMKLEGRTSGPTESTLSGPGADSPTLERHPSHPGLSCSPGPDRSAARSMPRDSANPASPRTETQGASIYHLSNSDAAGDVRLQSIGSSEQYTHSDAKNSAAPVGPTSPKHIHLINTDLPLQRPGSPRAVAFVESGGKEAAYSSPVKPDSANKSSTQGSFLLDDNESLSDISTEIADQSGDDSLGVRSFFFDDTLDEDDILPRPSFKAPPTPPSTVGAAFDRSPERNSGRSLVQTRTVEESKPPHLKEAQSAPKLLSPNMDRQRMRDQKDVSVMPIARPPNLRRVQTSPGTPAAIHMPFVLAFESEVIAEQMTIIEKDALDELDWKDLISLNWHQAPPEVRNWVEYLKKQDSTGVDIIVARFNLVVKWVVSECVLTEMPSERAKCITKYIHIATHCHRFRNYASMYQITLALLSTDLARLQRTWALVPPIEKQKLDRLERLCQPVRNFYNLRAEMESTTINTGCIPFIGLYTHDLIFNAQKPARLDPPPPGNEQLINFERYQTAATIAKSMLRLIEASSKYIFHPHPEVLSRCLWLAALEDSEISKRSRMLEQ